MSDRGARVGFYPIEGWKRLSDSDPGFVACEIRKGYEIKTGQVVATISGGVANTPEARPAGEFAAGTRIGAPGCGSWAGDIRHGHDSRAGTGWTGVADSSTHPPVWKWDHQTGEDILY